MSIEVLIVNKSKKILALCRNMLYTKFRCRDVAQFGSALRSGRRGRRFESCHPDHYFKILIPHRVLVGDFSFVRDGLVYNCFFAVYNGICLVLYSKLRGEQNTT